MAAGLLDGQEQAVELVNGNGRGRVVLVCEHASNRIPTALGTLGLTQEDLTRHIAWDIGAEAVARRLSALLDAPLVLQRYSRLVYDCNRPPESPGAMPEVSETTVIPGNRDLSPEARAERTAALYTPFHAAVGALLDARIAADAAPIFVTIHSFTPVFKGVARAVQLGILHDADSRAADALLSRMKAEPTIDTRRNEPYGPADGVTHTLNINAGVRGLQNVMIEIRNDLISNEAGQTAWASRLAGLLAQISTGE